MNIFKITLINNYDKYREDFDRAFNDIYALVKLICDSKNKFVKHYIGQHIENDDPDWIYYEKDSVLIMAGCGEIEIQKSDSQQAEIEYDFGKRLPADDMLLCAIMSIFKHHLSNAIIDDEAEPFIEEFNNGVYLVSLINDNIRNPYTNSQPQVTTVSAEAQKIYQALKQ